MKKHRQQKTVWDFEPFNLVQASREISHFADLPISPGVEITNGQTWISD